MSVAESLKRIETWAKTHGATLGLRPGATDAALDAAEATCGFKLPADYRELMRAADGQSADATFPWMPGCERLASLDAAVAQCGEERGLAEEMPPPDAADEADDRIMIGRYRTPRLPIAGSEYWDGDVTFLDFAPGPSGAAGQLITMVTECDFVVLGASLAAALERYATALEAGALVWADGNLTPKGAEPHADHPANQFAQLT